MTKYWRAASAAIAITIQVSTARTVAGCATGALFQAAALSAPLRINQNSFMRPAIPLPVAP
jgi:hypothetical protein